MKSFHSRSVEAYQNIGPWAADYYIRRVVTEFLRYSEAQEDANAVFDDGWAEDEKRYLSKIFRGIDPAPVAAGELTSNVSSGRSVASERRG